MARNIPKDQAHVFENLVAQAALIKGATSLLVEEAGSFIGIRPQLAGSIRLLQTNNDRLASENTALLSEFTTVFSNGCKPEALRLLSSSLNSILGAIEEAAFLLGVYPCTWLMESIPACCACLKASAEEICALLEAIAHSAALTQDSPTVTELLTHAHDLLRSSVTDLSSRDDQGLTVFTNREICNALLLAVTLSTSAIRQLLHLDSE